MTNAELIAKLQTLPQDLPVYVYVSSYEGEVDEVRDVIFCDRTTEFVNPPDAPHIFIDFMHPRSV